MPMQPNTFNFLQKPGRGLQIKIVRRFLGLENLFALGLEPYGNYESHIFFQKFVNVVLEYGLLSPTLCSLTPLES